jgi:phenylacetate-CoA ligase
VILDDILQFEPTVLVSTPTDALRLLQAAVQRRVELADGPIRRVLVTGEAGGSIGSTRRRIEERFAAHCQDVYALTEVGVAGWGCSAAGGIHLDETHLVCESFVPESEPARECRDGEVGELVISTRSAHGTPLAHFRTGDLVQLSRDVCACGRTEVRAEGGVLGRLTERFVVRGVQMLPSTIEHVVLRHPAVTEYHLRTYNVRGVFQISVQIEADDAVASEGDRARVAAEVGEDLRRSLGLRVECDIAPPGSLRDQDAGRRARRLSRQ